MYGIEEEKYTIEQLVKFHTANVSKIAELEFYNESLKAKTTALLKSNTYLKPWIFSKTEMFDNMQGYIDKQIKRGDERYKSAKANYDYILSILTDYISPDIKKINKVVQQYGYNYNLVAICLYFTLNDTEYELELPIIENISIADVWRGNLFTDYCAKYRILKGDHSCWSTIWSGTDLTKFKDEYKFDESEDNK